MPHKPTGKGGFTLLEIILVLVVLLVVSGIVLPNFAGSLRGSKLRSSARTISRMTKYARNMAILREETLTVVLNHETMEIYLGGSPQAPATDADGELDQDVLKRLGYVDDNGQSPDNVGVEKEIRRFLPDDLAVTDFNKDSVEEDDAYEDLYLIRFFANGQCEWFELRLEDNRGMGVKLENDPISGKIRTEFTQ